jgi:hypothetical protein
MVVSLKPTYTCMHTSLHSHAPAHDHTCICTYTYLHTQIHAYTCTCTPMLLHMLLCVPAHTCFSTYMHLTHMNLRMCTHSPSYTSTYTHMHTYRTLKLHLNFRVHSHPITHFSLALSNSLPFWASSPHPNSNHLIVCC